MASELYEGEGGYKTQQQINILLSLVLYDHFKALHIYFVVEASIILEGAWLL